MKHKIKLETIKVKSFITSADVNISTIRGGTNTTTKADELAPSATTCSGTTLPIFTGATNTCL